jgi:hypothetical protein
LGPDVRRGAALLAAMLVVAAPASARLKSPGLAALTPSERGARQAVDLASLATYRAGLARTVAYARAHPELFPTARPAGARLLTADERDAVRTAWKSMLDFTIALDSLERFHADFYLLTDTRARARSLHIAGGAFRVAYRFALDFVTIAENDPKLGIVLNDSVDDLGLPAGTYDRYKFRFLNVAAATRFAAYALAGQAFGPLDDAATARAAGEDNARILEAGRGRGEALTAANAISVLRKLGAGAVFPAQAGISAWMGDTKVLRHQRSLITPRQIEELRGRMLPGDIMLQRREWYLSNVGLPGFWSHAALFVGTPEERRAFFGADDVRRWVMSRGEASGDLERLLERLQRTSPSAAISPQKHGLVPRVLEAISEGVVFTTLEHSAGADSVVVLRPRLDRVGIAAALVRAWAYVGRPYDFDFDFQTDSALVCTELVYKAYEPSAQTAGLRFRLEEILGRTAIPANTIARQFDEEFGTPGAQLDMIAFLDGQEKRGAAVPAGVDEFRASWRRPKWHVLIQDSGGPAAGGR